MEVLEERNQEKLEIEARLKISGAITFTKKQSPLIEGKDLLLSIIGTSPFTIAHSTLSIEETRAPYPSDPESSSPITTFPKKTVANW
jgi:hypothetical protein